MAEVHESGEFGASVDEVWKIVGDFPGLVQALGAPVETEGPAGVGQKRKVAVGAGDPLVEQLEECDESAKRVVYTILSGPLPVQNYRATMQLSDAGSGRTKLDWSATFEPAGGLSEGDVKPIVSGIFTNGIGGLQGRFGA